MLPIIVLSAINGFHETIKARILDKDFHLQIFHQDENFENAEKLCVELKKIPGLKYAFPYHDGKAIIKYESEKTGIVLRGYIPEMYFTDKSFKNNFRIIETEFFPSKNTLTIDDYKKITDTLSDSDRRFFAECYNIKSSENIYELKSDLLLSKKDKLTDLFISLLYLKENTIILGDRLAEQLGVKINGIVEIYVDREGPVASFNFGVKRFKVTGIFRSGYTDFDKNMAFINLNDAQKIYNYVVDFYGIKSYKVYGIGVKIDNIDDYLLVKSEITAKFPELRVRTYQQTNGNILYAFEWEKKLMMVVLLIMVIATVLTVMLILTIVVMDKKKEIGILKSFGVKTSIIKSIFIFEGYLISFIGTLLGLILGILITINIKEVALFVEWLVNSYINLVKDTWIGILFGIDKNTGTWEIITSRSLYSRNFPYKIDFFDIFLITIMTLFWSLVGALLPAKRATKITVIEAIRHE